MPHSVFGKGSAHAERAVKDTQKIHAVRPCADGSFFTRELACCCGPCVRGEHGAGMCKNASYTGSWKRAELDAVAAMEEEDEDEPEDVHDDIIVGDIICVPRTGPKNASQRPFHLLKVTHAPEILDDALDNSWLKSTNGRPTRFLTRARVVRCNWLAELDNGLFELWDDAWVNAGRWAGPKPWPEVPLVVIDVNDIAAVGVELIPAAPDVRRRLKDSNPGQLFDLPFAEEQDLRRTVSK